VLGSFQSGRPEEYEKVHGTFEEAGCEPQGENAFVREDDFENVLGWDIGFFGAVIVTIVLTLKAASAGGIQPRSLDLPKM
jgi:hypothetical protein